MSPRVSHHVCFCISSPAMVSLHPAEVQITIGGQDQEAKISSYEDALAKIKDTTGVSDIQVSAFYL